MREVNKGEYEHTFRVGSASCSWLSGGQVVDRIRYDFSRPEQLFAWVRTVQIKDRSTWVYTHGLGYALTLLDFWCRLGRSDETLLWAVLEDPPTIVCTRRGRRLVKYVDILNYWRVPLCELAEGTIWADKTSRPDHAPDPFPLDRARAKVRLIEDLICNAIRLVAMSKMCTWQCTAAALAWSSYRTGWLQSKIWVHGHQAASLLERDSLFGGLLSLSRAGWVRQSVYSLDVQSLYPAMMAAMPMPCKLVSYQEEASLSELRQGLKGYHCVADVSFYENHPPLPHRHAGLVSHSSSAGLFSLCGPELALAADTGLVSHCGRLARYEREDMFSGFVAHFYAQKRQAEAEGRLTDRLLYKLILNGLSGKFAQKKRRWMDDRQALCPNYWAFWWVVNAGSGRPVRYRAIAGRAQFLQEGGETRNSFPAITAAITSFARHELRRLVEVAGPGNVCYTDTDCLHVNDAGLSPLALFGEIRPGQLGHLREVARGKDAYYWGPKHYRVGDYWCSNVIQMTARNVCDGVWLQESKRGLEQSFTRGILDRVLVRDVTVTVGTGPGAYRPIIKQGFKEPNGQTTSL